jgi:hypothetical protein
MPAPAEIPHPTYQPSRPKTRSKTHKESQPGQLCQPDKQGHPGQPGERGKQGKPGKQGRQSKSSKRRQPATLLDSAVKLLNPVPPKEDETNWEMHL